MSKKHLEPFLYLKNKFRRQMAYQGRDLRFIKFKEDDYHQLTDEIERIIELKGIYHQGGGYGGMLNYELIERDGGRTISFMKPMILAFYEDAKDISMDWRVVVGGELFRVVEKNDVNNLNVAFDISLESVNDGRVFDV